MLKIKGRSTKDIGYRSRNRASFSSTAAGLMLGSAKSNQNQKFRRGERKGNTVEQEGTRERTGKQREHMQHRQAKHKMLKALVGPALCQPHRGGGPTGGAFMTHVGNPISKIQF